MATVFVRFFDRAHGQLIGTDWMAVRGIGNSEKDVIPIAIPIAGLLAKLSAPCKGLHLVF